MPVAEVAGQLRVPQEGPELVGLPLRLAPRALPVQTAAGPRRFHSHPSPISNRARRALGGEAADGTLGGGAAAVVRTVPTQSLRRILQRGMRRILQRGMLLLNIRP